MDTKPGHSKREGAAGLGSRAERIAFSVLRAIADQRLAPGTRLSEGDLAKVFDVSRTIVRQALTLRRRSCARWGNTCDDSATRSSATTPPCAPICSPIFMCRSPR